MLKLELVGRVVPKARPRFGRGYSYLPPLYREWKENAVALLVEQWGNKPTLNCAKVYICFEGKHQGDLDNLAGSILDALVAAQIIQDDRLQCVPCLTIEHKKAQQTKVVIILTILD